MNRRKFLRATCRAIASAAVVGGRWDDWPSAAGAGKANFRDLFDSDDPTVLAFAQRVFEKCVLEKLRAPVEPLRHTWVQPGGPYYQGQWIWDTMFVVDLLSLLPDHTHVIRDIFQNYWDFQDRWNKSMPAYAHDMVVGVIKTAPQEPRQFSQIPILAWGVDRVYQRNQDPALLQQCLNRLERFHNWFWRERDVTGLGLIAPGLTAASCSMRAGRRSTTTVPWTICG